MARNTPRSNRHHGQRQSAGPEPRNETAQLQSGEGYRQIGLPEEIESASCGRRKTEHLAGSQNETAIANRIKSSRAITNPLLKTLRIRLVPNVAAATIPAIPITPANGIADANIARKSVKRCAANAALARAIVPDRFRKRR